MKNKNNFSICLWLAIIAFLILCGVILFAAYIYKFDPLSMFSDIFSFEANVFWTALNTIGTVAIGVVTILINQGLSKVQEQQSKLQIQQHTLYTEPHILIDSFDVMSTDVVLTSNKKEIKTIKDFDYPYYTNNTEELNFLSFSILAVKFVNTSEAFARLRFDSATIYTPDETIAEFNMSSFGSHKNHIMLRKGETGVIGLLINNSLIEKINGSSITVRTFLDNNFKDSFRDEQTYHLSRVCEGSVTFLVVDISKNVFERIER